jgi:hypothetical protein
MLSDLEKPNDSSSVTSAAIRLFSTITNEGSSGVKRTEFTYGQLDKVLRSLGFACRLSAVQPPSAHL